MKDSELRNHNMAAVVLYGERWMTVCRWVWRRERLVGRKTGNYHTIKALEVQDPRKDDGNESLLVV